MSFLANPIPSHRFRYGVQATKKSVSLEKQAEI